MTTKAPVYMTVCDGVVMVDGLPWRETDRAEYRGSVVYVPDTVPDEAIQRMCTVDGDSLFGSPAAVYGARLRAGSGNVLVIRGKCWGATGGLQKVRRHIELLRGQCGDARIRWRRTAASTAGGMYVAAYPRERATRARWRSFCRSAAHSGPIVHCRASSKRCIHIDRRSAYLAGMTAPLPVGQPTWISSPRERDMGRPGFIQAKVSVRPGPWTDELPPLPYRIGGGRTAYPVGVITGVWPTFLLREAMDRGEIERVRPLGMVAYGAEEPWLMPLAESIMRCERKLRKLLYTRLVGKFMSSRGWTGTVQGGRVDWSWLPPQLHETRVPNTVRPDIAAYVYGRNLSSVIQSHRQTEPGRLVATFVDALWTEDIAGARRLVGDSVGEWREEGVGPVRVYRSGVYHMQREHGDKVGAMGWPYGGTPTAGEIAGWAGRAEPVITRSWDANPAEHPGARSVAAVSTTGESNDCIQLHPAATGLWTRRGYTRRAVEAAWRE